MGLELLEPEDEADLNQIQHGSHRDVSECCKQMFRLWLERCPDATWEHLIQVLREVGLNHLATKIDGMLQKTESILATVRGKYLDWENIGEFGEFVAIRQIFTLQMS